jgi:hypothetical protein
MSFPNVQIKSGQYKIETMLNFQKILDSADLAADPTTWAF